MGTSEWESNLEKKKHKLIKPLLQLDPFHLNPVIQVDSTVISTSIRFPWICPSVIYCRLFRTHARYFELIFRFPREFEIAGFNCNLDCYSTQFLESKRFFHYLVFIFVPFFVSLKCRLLIWLWHCIFIVRD